MRITHITLIGLTAIAGSIAAQGQQQAAANPAPQSAAASPVAKDCTKATKRHDHGLEKGMAPSIPNPCAQAGAASAPRARKLHGPRQAS